MSLTNAKAKGFIKGALLVPALGVAAHIAMGFMSGNYEPNIHADWNWSTEYSLKHRFETAYSFNTPENHKTYNYYNTRWSDGILEHDNGEKTPYWPTSPYITYSAMLACGLLGACRAARRERYGR